MKVCLQHIRRYPFSVFCIILIWVLSLTPFFPETPFDDVQFADKWTHMIMYGGTCSVIWIEYIRSHKVPALWGRHEAGRLFLWAWLAPVLMGGLLELLQAYATTTRNGDWLDFAANTLGVTLGAVSGLILMFFARR